jgi:hypothetical protein
MWIFARFEPAPDGAAHDERAALSAFLSENPVSTRRAIAAFHREKRLTERNK